MEGNIVYKSTSEFLKFISDKTKAKNNKNNKTNNRNKINKNKSNTVDIQQSRLNFQ